MTKYRIVSDGYASHLQYLKEYKILGISCKKWSYIFYPYYDKIYGRSLDSNGYDTLVCSYNTNFAQFTKEWKDINLYFEWAEKEQKRLEDKAAEYDKEIKRKKNEIKYL